jgi:aminopeptidase-like protein
VIGSQIHNLANKLWPIYRSITGPGFLKTLEILNENFETQIELHTFRTGEKAFDWTIPLEYEVEDAWIQTPDGKKICNFGENNLHLVGYSEPVDESLSLEKLQRKLFSLPDQPDAIPYVTSYYERGWGFCISDRERKKLVAGEYKVHINSRLFEGELNVGEVKIKGNSKKEILFSTYICHPSMANNELSGPCIAAFLIKYLEQLVDREYTYRFLFVPETIGPIAYLSRNLKRIRKHVIAGIVLTCIGDNGPFSLVQSRRENTLIERIVINYFKIKKENLKLYSWVDRGSDERQYGAPGIELPVCTLTRTKYREYPEYHTSLDDLFTVVTPEGLQKSYDWLVQLILEIESLRTPKSCIKGEPQLGRRGLYKQVSIKSEYGNISTLLHIHSYCDGTNNTLDIAIKIGLTCTEVKTYLDILKSHKLIKYC